MSGGDAGKPEAYRYVRRQRRSPLELVSAQVVQVRLLVVASMAGPRLNARFPVVPVGVMLKVRTSQWEQGERSSAMGTDMVTLTLRSLSGPFLRRSEFGMSGTDFPT